MADTDLSAEVEEEERSGTVEDLGEPDDADLADDTWDDLEDDVVDDELVESEAADESGDGDGDGDEAGKGDAVVEDGEDEEALDELEAEELEMLTDDEASETLIVDEQQELRAIRRAEISLADDAGGEREEDEFLCQSCFLLLKISQLADKRRTLCHDCAA